MAKSYNDIANKVSTEADAFEVMVDAALDKAVIKDGVIEIDAPLGITEDIFAILVSRYKAVGWDSVTVPSNGRIKFTKKVKTCSCGETFVYKDSDIHPDSRDGNYLICPGCGTFINVGSSVNSHH